MRNTRRLRSPLYGIGGKAGLGRSIMPIPLNLGVVRRVPSAKNVNTGDTEMEKRSIRNASY